MNDRLRVLMRYHGELSRYIDDALTSLDLATIELMPVTLGRTARGITAIVSGSGPARVLELCWKICRSFSGYLSRSI